MTGTLKFLSDFDELKKLITQELESSDVKESVKEIFEEMEETK
jgi:hypothetical protein